jgi:hypothetical protein
LSATKLATARTIQGKSFDGTADITFDVATTEAAGLMSAADKTKLNNFSGYLSNKNILHNWDFRNPVNQPGWSSYTGNDIYTIDRWKILGAGSVTLNSGYITLAASVPELQFLQWIEPAYSRFAGKTLTISAMLANGTILSGSATVPASKPSAWTNIINIITSFGYVQFSYDKTADRLFFTVIVLDDKTVDLAAVKLELGSVSTLANDPPADYGEELRKCRYYFQKVGTGLVALARSTTEVYIWGPFGGKMRTSPTLTLNTTDIFLHGMEYNADKTSSGSAILNVGTFEAGIKYLKINGFTGLTAGAVYGVAADYINADANI